MIKLAITDDEALFRKGMAILIGEFDGMEVIFESGNGQELLQELASREVLPDVLLLDLNMPELNGVETAKELQKKYPQIGFIILSTYYTKEFIL
ncbi:MAG: response regulator transcription factor, partial [Bacteroidota bacterium]